MEVSLPVAPDNKPIRFMFLPQGEDPDTFVRRHGKDAFERDVRAAETLSQFLISELRAECDLNLPEGRARLVSIARAHVQKVTAPVLRLQLANEIAQLARVSDAEINGLLELPQRPQFTRQAPIKRSYGPPQSMEWSLLAALLSDLTLVEHIDSELLDPELPESKALLAIKDRFASSEGEPTFPVLFDALEGNPWIKTVLAAYQYGQDLDREPEEILGEVQGALVQLDIRRRKRELDELRTRPMSKEDLVAWQEKNLVYKRLQGAIPAQAAP
jgi:DNA primase